MPDETNADGPETLNELLKAVITSAAKSAGMLRAEINGDSPPWKKIMAAQAALERLQEQEKKLDSAAGSRITAIQRQAGVELRPDSAIPSRDLLMAIPTAYAAIEAAREYVVEQKTDQTNAVNGYLNRVCDDIAIEVATNSLKLTKLLQQNVLSRREKISEIDKVLASLSELETKLESAVKDSCDQTISEVLEEFGGEESVLRRVPVLKIAADYGAIQEARRLAKHQKDVIEGPIQRLHDKGRGPDTGEQRDPNRGEGRGPGQRGIKA